MTEIAFSYCLSEKDELIGSEKGSPLSFLLFSECWKKWDVSSKMSQKPAKC